MWQSDTGTIEHRAHWQKLLRSFNQNEEVNEFVVLEAGNCITKNALQEGKLAHREGIRAFRQKFGRNP